VSELLQTIELVLERRPAEESVGDTRELVSE
jgi:hypothetical protein